MSDSHAPERPKTTLESFARTLAPDWELEDWALWPPDLFALTSRLLQTTGAYCHVVDPPCEPWPDEGWTKALDLAVREWYQWMLTGTAKPRLLEDNILLLQAHWRTFPISRLRSIDPHRPQDFESWKVCRALLELHILADAACTRSGFPIGNFSRWGPERPREMRALDYVVNMLLAHRGTLSRLPRETCVVLPKIRTPQVGLTLRSLSHFVTVHQSEAKVLWRTVPWVNSEEDTVNLMIVPWPLQVEAAQFSTDPRTTNRKSGEPHRFFRYAGDTTQPPGSKADDLVTLLEEAEKAVHKVHVVVLPELALSESDLEAVLNRISQRDVPRDKVPMVIAGIHSPERNQVVLATFFAGKWYRMYQDKHHRWKVDRQQIQQYDLAGILSAGRDWWESIKIMRRQITFLAPNPWLTLCPLICEDLARLEPVSELIRGVGPTLLIAILMDGPQLQQRWSGRYASVLADDPGTSVLTVSSLGMAVRSKPRDPSKQPRRTVSLWKDSKGHWEEIDLQPGHGAVLLTVNAAWTEEFSADGRGDGGEAATLEFQSAQQIALPGKPKETRSGEEAATPPAEPHPYVIGFPRDIRDLTEFTYFVDAALEADPDTLRQLALWASGSAEEPSWLGAKKREWLPHFKAHDVVRSLRTSAKTEDNFDAFVRWGYCWLRRQSRSLSFADPAAQFPYWERLVAECEAILNHLASPRFREVVLPRWKVRKHYGTMPKSKYVRVRIYVLLSVLWAVHNRLAFQRSVNSLTPPGAALLEKIESVLARRHDDIWYQAALLLGEDIFEGSRKGD